eukprot:249944_1
MSTVIILATLFKLSTAGLYDNCYECFEGICCDDPITKIDTLICKHWVSSSGTFGAPLDVCFGRFGGAEAASVSQMYKCKADGSTVELYDYTGCSDCSCTPTLRTDFNAIFNPIQYPDRDSFNCSGDPCPYYIIEDGTAHRSQECPFDTGKDYSVDQNAQDYATWHVKLILEGCQSFGSTSTLLKCDSSSGILQMNFGNDKCDFDPNNNGGNTDNKTLNGGVVECNLDPANLGLGTGRSVYCSDEIITTVSPTTTDAITTQTDTTKAGTTASRTTKSDTTQAGTTTQVDTTQADTTQSTGTDTTQLTGTGSTASATTTSETSDTIIGSNDDTST